ncbi:hypothetical protein BCR42DRAFT_418413 [Absidia repens]|uniref:Rab-GAP TBC domain-containing protein n=1 Tax=Absidia repens TaxID=90262 RepID=A0A1X2IBQ1_9FUNG|nr:hypothetical protein BCR42DRAFT_418413 [Absidia repens]
MTVLQERRQAWDVIFSDPNLSEQSLQQRGITGTVCEKGLRSVCWKVYLGYLPNLNVSTWSAIQMNERKRYTDLRRQYIEEPAELMTKKSDNLSDNNPLALNESNPWQQYFADSEIRKVIRQDVDRTFPDVDFFRSETVQEKMTDILFIYCKIHHDVSYRQGMHELLAPFYWNIATESLDEVPSDDIDACLSDPTNRLMVQVLDPTFIEHDTFLLFDRLMSYAKPWYEFNNSIPPAKSLNRRSKSAMDLTTSDNSSLQQTNLNPVVGVCQRIHHQYLRLVDPPLYKHLENFGIEPQLFGIRWLRLLFGREFEFYELLRLWDAIFAQDPTLEIAEFVCLAILLRLHDQLIENDYAECLSLLMRGTRISKPITLVEQAKYLQGNLSHDGALQILRQNDLRAGKEPRASLWKNDLEKAALPYQQQSQHQQRRQQASSNLDNITNITRGVMKSSQVRDLNKTIAGVMGTVQKNVNLFGDNVLGRNVNLDGQQSQRRRLTVPSEFPDGIDRVAPSSGQVYNQPSATLPRSSSSNSMQRASINTFSSPALVNRNNDNNNTTAAALATIQKVNRQMGGLMAQCIDVLEKELFSNDTTLHQQTPTISTLSTKPTTLAGTSTSTEIANEYDVIQQAETVEPALSGSDGNAAATTDESTNSGNDSAKDRDYAQDMSDETTATTTAAPETDTPDDDDTARGPADGITSGSVTTPSTDQKRGPDEASLTLALAGLKHIRDVLQGKQLQFDSNVLDLDLATAPSTLFAAKDSTENGSLLGQKERRDITKKPLPNIQQKHASIGQQQQQQQPEPEKARIDSPVTATTPAPTRPVTNKHIPPTNRPKSQHQVTYSIEDLLSDPALQTSGGGRGSDQHHHTTSKKFQWMIDKDNSDSNTTNQGERSTTTTTTTTAHLFSSNDKDPATPLLPSSTDNTDDIVPILGQQQHHHHHRPTSRQRSSMNLNRVSKTSSASDATVNHVDPLDAKNVDKRYSYEYDIYH